MHAVFGFIEDDRLLAVDHLIGHFLAAMRGQAMHEDGARLGAAHEGGIDLIGRQTLLPHGGVNVLGLVFEERSTGAKFVYYTDCKRVPREAVALARGAGAIVLDGLRPESHPTHMNIEEAVVVAREIGAPITHLTHLTHAVDHASCEAKLPPKIRLAYDGLRLNL